MPFADTRRATCGVAYRRLGTGAPVMLLHGLPGSSSTWARVAKHLARDHDVIVPDLLGFGASAKPASLERLHAAAQAQSLIQLLDELRIDRVAIVGHDFGGPVAVCVAGGRPERVTCLGVLATNLFSDTPIPFPLSTTTWPLLGTLAQRLLFSRPALITMLRTGTGRPRIPLDAAHYLGCNDQTRSIRTIFAGSLTRLHELYEPIERDARALAVTAFVGWGTRDPFLPLAQGERTAAALATPLRVYADAGHFLPEERPHDVATDIADLMRRPEPAENEHR